MAVEITGSLIQSGSQAQFVTGLDIKQNQYDFGDTTLEATFSGTYSVDDLLNLGLNNPDIPAGASSTADENIFNYTIGSGSNDNTKHSIWEVSSTTSPYPNDILLTTSASTGEVTDILLTMYQGDSWKFVAEAKSTSSVTIPANTIGIGQELGTKDYIFMSWGSDFNNKKTGIRHTIVRFTKES